jgi:hypothetical protein
MDTCVFPAHFVDQIEFSRDLTSLEALPSYIQTPLRQYLVDRLGAVFFARLRFRSAVYMDPELVPQIVQNDQRLSRQFVAYVVLFDLPLVGGSTYCAGVHLTADGSLAMGIGFPRVSADPTKGEVIPLSKAEDVAARHGLHNPNPLLTRLLFSPDRDSLVWQVSEISAGENNNAVETTCHVDAHSGRFLGWTSGEIVF